MVISSLYCLSIPLCYGRAGHLDWIILTLAEMAPALSESPGKGPRDRQVSPISQRDIAFSILCLSSCHFQGLLGICSLRMLVSIMELARWDRSTGKFSSGTPKVKIVRYFPLSRSCFPRKFLLLSCLEGKGRDTSAPGGQVEEAGWDSAFRGHTLI